VGTWHDPGLGWPIAAPLERCAQLLGVDLATVQEVAATVEPYVRADGTRIWSMMQLERQLRPEAYGRRRGGYLDRRQTPAAIAPPRRSVEVTNGQVTSSLDLHLGPGIAGPDPMDHQPGSGQDDCGSRLERATNFIRYGGAERLSGVRRSTSVEDIGCRLWMYQGLSPVGGCGGCPVAVASGHD
jgi:hypothetical protein